MSCEERRKKNIGYRVASNERWLKIQNVRVKQHDLCYHFLVAIVIGSVATPSTTAIIVVSDFLINIYHGYCVVKLAKEKGKDDSKGLFLINHLSSFLCCKTVVIST